MKNIHRTMNFHEINYLFAYEQHPPYMMMISGKIIGSEEFPAEMMTGYTLPYDLFLLHFERQITRSCNKMGIVDGNLWDIFMGVSDGIPIA